jgi:hypothetical protein
VRRACIQHSTYSFTFVHQWHFRYTYIVAVPVWWLYWWLYCTRFHQQWMANKSSSKNGGGVNGDTLGRRIRYHTAQQHSDIHAIDDSCTGIHHIFWTIPCDAFSHFARQNPSFSIFLLRSCVDASTVSAKLCRFTNHWALIVPR